MKLNTERIQKQINKIEQMHQRLVQYRLFSGLIGLMGLTYILFQFSWPLSIVVLISFSFHIYLIKISQKQDLLKKQLFTYLNWAQRHESLKHSATCNEYPIPAPENINETMISLNRDLDLINGSRPFIYYIDATFTQARRKNLIARILRPLNSAEEIIKQQKLTQNLSQSPWWIKRLMICGTTLKKQLNENNATTQLNESLIQPGFYKHFIFHIALYILFWASLVIIYTQGLKINYSLPITFFIILSYTMRGPFQEAFQKALNFSAYTQGIKSFLNNYLHNQPYQTKKLYTHFNSSFLVQLNKLKFFISLLSSTTNPIAHIALNFIFPWEPLTIVFLERWRKAIAPGILTFSKELSDLELQISYSLFHITHTNTLPKLKTEKTFNMISGYHPSIPKKQSVPNNYQFSDNTMAIITGSNMAGKSTFLRTVGLNQHLATLGLSVFAKEFTTYYAPVESCLRIADSISEGVSSFYYEVKRIKCMIDKIQNNEPFLYLIDEIFRGTNNIERNIGSQAVIKSLSQSKSALGFISTHDLELSHIKNPMITNIHFSDGWSEKGELTFTYKLQQGPSKTTNALKIMQLNGLPVDAPL